MDLFEEFKGVSHQDWLTQITRDLKGKDFNENLVTKTEDGFDIQPIYTIETLANNKANSYNLAKQKSEWEIREQITITTPKETNQKALSALKAGANSIQYNGLISNQTDFNQLLDNVMIDIIQLHFYSPNPIEVDAFLTDFISKNELTKSNLNYTVSNDYLGEFLISGKKVDLSQLKTINTITVNGVNYTNAGASASQELAFTLNQAVEYITKGVEQGVTTQEIVNKLKFTLGVGSNYFLEIAKIRAFKILWNLITEEYKVKNTPYIHSQTTTYNITAADAQTNILRTTTEAMSAIIGGCNSLSITPFNSAYEQASDFTNRIARNIQMLLKEEAYLDKVNDASKGAYYIEELTDNLVNSALNLFKEIEANGGFLVNIKNGTIQNSIQQNHNNRIDQYLTNKKTLLGVNKHTNKTEKTPQAITINKIENPSITPLKPINLGSEILNQQTLANA